MWVVLHVAEVEGIEVGKWVVEVSDVGLEGEQVLLLAVYLQVDGVAVYLDKVVHQLTDGDGLLAFDEGQGEG